MHAPSDPAGRSLATGRGIRYLALWTATCALPQAGLFAILGEIGPGRWPAVRLLAIVGGAAVLVWYPLSGFAYRRRHLRAFYASLEQGRAALGAQRWPAARLAFQEALSVATPPEFDDVQFRTSDALLGLAIAAEKMGDVRDAEQWYRGARRASFAQWRERLSQAEADALAATSAAYGRYVLRHEADEGETVEAALRYCEDALRRALAADAATRDDLRLTQSLLLHQLGRADEALGRRKPARDVERGSLSLVTERHHRMLPPAAPRGASLVTALLDVAWWVMFGSAMLLLAYMGFCR